MFIYYECNVCCHEVLHKPESDKCPLCDVGDMISMTVIRSDVLEKLKSEISLYRRLEENATKEVK
jgi:hypothetical protein